jgi:hypothetical protein
MCWTAAMVSARRRASMQIDLAKALGYATEQDLDELVAIKDKTKGEGSGLRLFDRIKALFSQANRQANARPKS